MEEGKMHKLECSTEKKNHHLSKKNRNKQNAFKQNHKIYK